MKRYFKLFVSVLVFIILVMSLWVYKDCILKGTRVKENDEIIMELEDLELNDISNLMIVAHPDDEMIWGGAQLIEDDYLVVCITCGVDYERVVEFKNVMNEVNDKYMMLGYPDLTDGKRDNWDNSFDGILSDLEKIINYKEWDKVVTHNPDGEYGHLHHKKTSVMVTRLSNGKQLYYFGKYYKEGKISSSLDKIGSELLDKKKDILKLYESQDYVVDVYSHMLPYENLILFSDWS